MTYEVKHPGEADRHKLDRLMSEDYRRSGIADKPPLTDIQMQRYSERAWVAYNQREEPEAIVVAGKWNYKAAAPYIYLPETALKLLGRAGLFKGQTGIYVMSAVEYEEGGALSALADQTEVLEPHTGAVHVPLLKNELAARAFLLGRGYYAGREGNDHITWLPDQAVATVLLTRKQ